MTTNEPISDLFKIDIDIELASHSREQPRGFQSADAFRENLDAFVVNIENGDIYTHLGHPPVPVQPTKVEAQKLLHAIEELYFYGHYARALALTDEALEGKAGWEAGLRGTVERYRKRCMAKVQQEKKLRSNAVK